MYSGGLEEMLQKEAGWINNLKGRFDGWRAGRAANKAANQIPDYNNAFEKGLGSNKRFFVSQEKKIAEELAEAAKIKKEKSVFGRAMKGMRENPLVTAGVGLTGIGALAMSTAPKQNQEGM